MNIDSRTYPADQIDVALPNYATSETSIEESGWIQPSISRETPNTFGSSIINGIYAQAPRLDMMSVVDQEMTSEFAAWEAASDEALNLFEAESS
jgi:hypothetical protein